MIITATLSTVATMVSLIINLEKECCRLKATRFAMKLATFTNKFLSYLFKNKGDWRILTVFFPKNQLIIQDCQICR